MTPAIHYLACPLSHRDPAVRKARVCLANAVFLYLLELKWRAKHQEPICPFNQDGIVDKIPHFSEDGIVSALSLTEDAEDLVVQTGGDGKHAEQLFFGNTYDIAQAVAASPRGMLIIIGAPEWTESRGLKVEMNLFPEERRLFLGGDFLEAMLYTPMAQDFITHEETKRIWGVLGQREK